MERLVCEFGFCELAIDDVFLAECLYESPAERDAELVLVSVRREEIGLICPAVDEIRWMTVLVGSNPLAREKLGWMVCVEQPLQFLT